MSFNSLIAWAVEMQSPADEAIAAPLVFGLAIGFAVGFVARILNALPYALPFVSGTTVEPRGRVERSIGPAEFVLQPAPIRADAYPRVRRQLR